MSSSTVSTVTAILQAAHYGGSLRIYHLGPFARRISFATQQTRALNLVWALKCGDKVKPGEKVAVIGGGLAGIMAAASLAELECKVTLFEATHDVLTRQTVANHRAIHPNINRWPEHAVMATTELPYFEWYSSDCASVFKMIRKDWNENFDDKQRKNKDKNGVKVEPRLSVKRHVPAGNAIGLYTQASLYGETFDVVLIATGFADEMSMPPAANRLPPFGSYWIPDRLEYRGQNDSGDFIISGCGDGGVIDALRLAFKESAFEGGKLAFEVASKLPPDHPASQIIKAAEENGALRSKDLEARFAAIPALEAEYLRAVAAMDPEFKRHLFGQLADRPLIIMTGNEPRPYSPAAAPINKLLLTIALSAARVVYIRGNWDFKKTPPEFFTTERQPYNDDTARITRLGASLVLEKSGFLSPMGLEQLRENQFAILDAFDGPHWRSEKTGKYAGHPKYDPGSGEFMDRRMDLLVSYLSDLRPNCSAGGTADGRVEVNLKRALGTAALPDTAFGMELVSVADVKASHVSAQNAKGPDA